MPSRADASSKLLQLIHLSSFLWTLLSFKSYPSFSVFFSQLTHGCPVFYVYVYVYEYICILNYIRLQFYCFTVGVLLDLFV